MTDQSASDNYSAVVAVLAERVYTFEEYAELDDDNKSSSQPRPS